VDEVAALALVLAVEELEVVGRVLVEDELACGRLLLVLAVDELEAAGRGLVVDELACGRLPLVLAVDELDELLAAWFRRRGA
jgi:hypothetical protein